MEIKYILKFILVMATLFVLIANFVVGNIKDGWKVTALFVLYLIYLVIS